ncbi:MAG: hypothetical protein GC162_10660 [Planctomycetes bacterium]|nr:hypothetical protein [Planctomycetota bacterium]
MSTQQTQIVIERIDYGSAFRFTRIFDCFRMALQPSRLMMALILLMIVFICGYVMDSMTAPSVVPDEFDYFAKHSLVEFTDWPFLKPGAVREERLTGVFMSSLKITLGHFESLVKASVQFKPGFDQLAPNTPASDETVLGSLRLMMMEPLWLWQAHRWFLIGYMVMFGLLWSLFGGAISRSCMVDAARGKPISATSAFRYAWRRWLWYILAPALPLLIVGALGLLLAIGGLLFYVWVLDILAGLSFALALCIGFIMALLIIGWVAGVHLMYPALSAEDSDAFDAMSRSYSYVLARPWRLLFYWLVALVYGAATYLIVGIFVYITLYLTRWAVGSWVTNFDATLPTPKFGDLISYKPDYEQLGWSGKVSAALVWVWVWLLIGVLGAYAISFYFSAYSVIYLLLRRYTDGTDVSQIAEDDADRKVPSDKLEPAPAPATPAAPLVPDPDTDVIS